MTAFDQALFASAIRGIIEARKLSDRQAAKQIGCSASTLTRTLQQGMRPDVENLARICDWAGMPVDAFIVRQKPLPETPLVSRVRSIAASAHASAAAASALRLLLDEMGDAS